MSPNTDRLTVYTFDFQTKMHGFLLFFSLSLIIGIVYVTINIKFSWNEKKKNVGNLLITSVVYLIIECFMFVTLLQLQLRFPSLPLKLLCDVFRRCGGHPTHIKKWCLLHSTVLIKALNWHEKCHESKNPHLYIYTGYVI